MDSKSVKAFTKLGFSSVLLLGLPLSLNKGSFLAHHHHHHSLHHHQAA